MGVGCEASVWESSVGGLPPESPVTAGMSLGAGLWDSVELGGARLPLGVERMNLEPRTKGKVRPGCLGRTPRRPVPEEQPEVSGYGWCPCGRAHRWGLVFKPCPPHKV